MTYSDADTIAAIATPVGEGGIAVIRVSGPNAIQISDTAFSGRALLRDATSHSAHVGRFQSRRREVIDEVVATVFRAPHSYTAEDVVELSCHGGVYVARAVLAELFAAGARSANPGEFTRRAFVNGKIDLSQAEAVGELISARSERFHKISLQHLRGDISKEITNLRSELLSVCSLLELELDFSEEQSEVVSKPDLERRLVQASSRINHMVDSFGRGRLCRDGVRIVLVGRPNVGKSSLFNKMLAYERAIVTNIPGTTRDTITEDLTYDGLVLRLVDTAGLRKTSDVIEKAGMQRTKCEIANADIILWLLDINLGITRVDNQILDQIRTRENVGKIIAVGNKSDLLDSSKNATNLIRFGEWRPIPVSARSGVGLDELFCQIKAVAAGDSSFSSESGITITSERHKNSLEKATVAINRARIGIAESIGNEIVAADLRIAMENLGEIIGIVTTEDILNTIFSSFCIGK